MSKDEQGARYANTLPLDPEWCKVPQAIALCGVSRSGLYEEFDTAGGPIRTATIKKRGALRGIRLVHVPSLRAWISSYANSPPPEVQDGAANREGIAR